MITKQVSVFLENKSGRLNEVAKILGDADINISVFTVADTSDFGVLRLIVSNPEKAVQVLKKNDFSARTTEVILLKSSNSPGALSKILGILSLEDIFVEYLYAFAITNDSATIVIRPTDITSCIKKIEKHNQELTNL